MAAKSSYQVQQHLTKLKNPDADLRYMALNDLANEARQQGFAIDDATEYQLVESVLALVQDVNGEVKSVAVKTLATLVPFVAPARIQTFIDRLVHLTASSDEGVRDIASLGLKMVVANVAPDSPLALTCCTKLAPEVVQHLADPASSAELLLDSLDLISDLLARFDATVRTLPHLHHAVLNAAIPLLAHPRAAVRKRTVATLAVLVPAAHSPALLDALLNAAVVPDLERTDNGARDGDRLRTAISLVGALTRSAPTQMGPRAVALVPRVLAASAVRDDDEGKEGVLQCLEAFVLRCPTEVSPHLSAIVDQATQLLRYDPNYAGDEDEPMGTGSDEDDLNGAGDEDEEEDEDEDEFDDDFDDDEDDTSWKVRRSATKLLTACISTRPDLLTTFYATVSPALVARFCDREETVRVEVWATYTELLRQTKTVAAAADTASQPSSASMAVAGGQSPRSHLKRKRSDSTAPTAAATMAVDTPDAVDASPLAQLHAQTPQIVRSIVKQLGIVKNVVTKQAGFTLLRHLLVVSDGGLVLAPPATPAQQAQVLSALVSRVEQALRTYEGGGLSGAATSLKIDVLAFVALVVRTHPVRVFTSELPRLVPLVALAIEDRFNKIAGEAFDTGAALVRALRPAPSQQQQPLSVQETQPYVAQLYGATMRKLSGPDADEDVKARGMATLGVIVAHAGDSLPDKDLDAALAFLRDRLSNEVQRVTAVRTVGAVAASPLATSDTVDTWAAQCTRDVAALLRKVHRPLKLAAFEALGALLARVGAVLDADTAQALLTDLAPLLDAQGADVTLIPHALATLVALLDAGAPTSASLVARLALDRVVALAVSPLLSAAAGTATDGLVAFFAAYVQAPNADGPQVVERLVSAGADADVAAVGVVARCLGAVVKAEVDQAGQLAAKVVDDQEKVLKSSKPSTNALILALLTLGEVGRIVDLGGHRATFEQVLDQFGAQLEDVRRSAAFAAGNIAVGNSQAFLPSILELIQSDDKKRYLALQALKEVIVHSTPAALASTSDALWTPLFENCEAQEEGTRNVAADCLGQLTVISPAKYLPQLQARLASSSHHTRATVIAALRFTFTNESTTYDELLAPLIVEFFKLMHDADLGVRRLALSSLSSAAHNKPHLVRSHLDTLLPELYAQTEVDDSLVRVVEMGPFKHKVDDGLDIRKTAYECMHSLLDSCLQDIDLDAFLSRVIAGLGDEEEVKKLSFVMLSKLAQVAPGAVTRRLDETVPSFEQTLGIVLKDNAVKQEAERTLELQKSAVRCLALLNKLASPAATPKFSAFISNNVSTGKMANEFKESSRQSQLVAMDVD